MQQQDYFPRTLGLWRIPTLATLLTPLLDPTLPHRHIHHLTFCHRWVCSTHWVRHFTKTSQGLSSELPYSSYSNIAAAAAMGVSAHPTSVPMSHSAPSIGTHSAPSSDTLVTPSATATVSTNPPGYKMEPTVKLDSDIKMRHDPHLN